LLDLASNLVFGCIDEPELGSATHMLQHDQIAHALEKIGDETAGIMTGIHHLIDHREERSAIVRGECVDGGIKQRGICHAELCHGSCIGDAIGARA
jgi:hypothetical protein